MHHELPKGCRPLKYLQYIPPKMFILSGLKNEEDADKKIEELKKNCISAFYDKAPQVQITQTVVGWGVVLPQDAIRFLSEEEKERVTPVKSPLTLENYDPIVYRFMDEKYIDEFLDTGKIMLTTQKRCQKLEDITRRDPTEGNGELIGKEGYFSCSISCGVGDNFLMLCTSLSREAPKNTCYNCCLEIRNVSLFAQSIAEQLISDGKSVQSVIKGPCVYSDRKIEKELSNGELTRITQMTSGAANLIWESFLNLIIKLLEETFFFVNRYHFLMNLNIELFGC